MKVIGLTGGIGSGKSTVSRFLAELGAVTMDADRVGHEIMNSDSEVRQEVVATFGRRILTPNGDIDRKKLGEIVFGHAGLLMQLNQIMHPRMYEIIKAHLVEYKREGVGVVVLEVPLLLEAGWISLVDEVWVTIASESTILKRLQERVGLSKEGSLARIHYQLSSQERIRCADVVINTDCSLDEVKAKVKELWDGLQTLRTSKTKT